MIVAITTIEVNFYYEKAEGEIVRVDETFKEENCCESENIWSLTLGSFQLEGSIELKLSTPLIVLFDFYFPSIHLVDDAFEDVAQYIIDKLGCRLVED